MSYTLLDNEIFEDKDLKHTEFRVLAFLIRNYNTKMGYSFPSRELIISSCKINKDTLGRVLNSLEEKGYITRKNNPLKAGKNNIYLIHKYLVVTHEKTDKEFKKEQVDNEKNKYKSDTSDIDDEKLISDYLSGNIEHKTSEDDDLKQKIETVECVIQKPISKGFINIVSQLTWDELIQIDSSLIGKSVNESYYLGAIYRIRPDLKCVI